MLTHTQQLEARIALERQPLRPLQDRIALAVAPIPSDSTADDVEAVLLETVLLLEDLRPGTKCLSKPTRFYEPTPEDLAWVPRLSGRLTVLDNRAHAIRDGRWKPKPKPVSKAFDVDADPELADIVSRFARSRIRQTDLAAGLGYGETYVSNVLNGNKPASGKFKARLQAWLDINDL